MPTNTVYSLSSCLYLINVLKCRGFHCFCRAADHWKVMCLRLTSDIAASDTSWKSICYIEVSSSSFWMQLSSGSFSKNHGYFPRIFTRWHRDIDHERVWKRKSPMWSRGSWNFDIMMLQRHDISHLHPDETVTFPRKQIYIVFYISSTNRIFEKPFLLELKSGISIVFLYDKAFHCATWYAKSFSANRLHLDYISSHRDWRHLIYLIWSSVHPSIHHLSIHHLSNYLSPDPAYLLECPFILSVSMSPCHNVHFPSKWKSRYNLN